MEKRFAISMLAALISLSGVELLLAAERPNVILIFIDDMGYGDVGFNGAKGPRTPQLDRMASEGLKFTDFYSGCAVGSGSRTALMTGCHYQRLSIAPVLFPNSDHGRPVAARSARILNHRHVGREWTVCDAGKRAG